MNEINYSVYVHTNKKNGMRYVGCTSQRPSARWESGSGYKGNRKFWPDIEKYGWEGFIHEVVFAHMDKETALLIEEILIKEFNTVENGYNCYYTDVKGHDRTTEESRRLNSLHNKGKHIEPFTDEHKRKISESKKGWVRPLEARLKQSKAKKGKLVGSDNPHAKRIINSITGNIYPTIKSCAEAIGASSAAICNGINNPNSKYFIYKYLD